MNKSYILFKAKCRRLDNLILYYIFNINYAYFKALLTGFFTILLV